MALDKQILRENGTLADLTNVGGAKELQPYQIGIATDVGREIFRDATDFRYNLNTMDDTAVSGDIPFLGADGKTIEYSTGVFMWDKVNDRLGVRTTPTAMLSIGDSNSTLRNLDIRTPDGNLFSIRTHDNCMVDFNLEGTGTSAEFFRFLVNDFMSIGIADGELRIDSTAYITFYENAYDYNASVKKAEILYDATASSIDFHVTTSAGMLRFDASPAFNNTNVAITAGELIIERGSYLAFGTGLSSVATIADDAQIFYDSSETGLFLAPTAADTDKLGITFYSGDASQCTYEFTKDYFKIKTDALNNPKLRVYHTGNTLYADIYSVGTSRLTIDNPASNSSIDFNVGTGLTEVRILDDIGTGLSGLRCTDNTAVVFGEGNDGYIYFDGVNHIAVLLLPEDTAPPAGIPNKALWIDTTAGARYVKSKA
jgi:hypothetical protein